MNRSVSVGVVALVVVVFVAGIGVPMTVAAESSARSSQPGSAQTTAAPLTSVQSQSTAADSIVTTQEFDRTTFEITVYENGSARWTFRHEQRFSSDNESDDREAFEEFAEEFESGETGLYDRFTEQAQAMTESGSELTGREMEATNFARSARVEEQFGTRGIVEMSFTWTKFATVDGDTVTVGDVFEDIYLGPDQAIEIEAGDGLTFRAVEPEEEAQHQRDTLADADLVRWSGEQQFLDGQPRVVFVRDGATGGADAPNSTITAGDNAAWYLAGAALVALTIGGAVWYRRHGGAWPDPDGETEPDPADPDAGAETAAQTGDPARTDANAAPADDREDGTDAALADEELLTDEDRVVKLIRENGGRMKQVNIVEETGWSKSKVSMLLSDMEEDGTISKLRVGRENIISLEGFEPEATKSPFDE